MEREVEMNGMDLSREVEMNGLDMY